MEEDRRQSNGNRHQRRPENQGDDDKNRRWRRPSRPQAFWIFSVLVLVFAAKFFGSMPSDERLVSYREYREYLNDGQILEAQIVGESEFHGMLRSGEKFVVNLGPIDAATKLEWE